MKIERSTVVKLLLTELDGIDMAPAMMLGDNFLINGVKIIEDRNMVVDGEPYEVKRTWRERLFTRPWKPFKTVNIVIPKIPSTKVIQYDDSWIMHPTMVAKLKEGINNVHNSEL